MKIVAGADFAQLAKEKSTDTGSRYEGGVLGYFGHGQMVPEFEACSLQRQEGVQPLQQTLAWHIKVDNRARRSRPRSRP